MVNFGVATKQNIPSGTSTVSFIHPVAFLSTHASVTVGTRIAGSGYQNVEYNRIQAFAVTSTTYEFITKSATSAAGIIWFICIGF